MKRLLCIGILLLPLMAPSATLRLEGDRAWLEVSRKPLTEVLALFQERGVSIMIDPALSTGLISGEWQNTGVGRLIEQLVSPHSYLLEWKNISSPLGSFRQVSAIRIFSDGRMADARPLSTGRKVFDVVHPDGGAPYIRGEIMVGFGADGTIDHLKALLARLDGTVIEVIDPPGIYRIRLNDNMSVEQALAIALAHDGVKAAEPNMAFPRIGSQPVNLSGGGAGINLQLQPGETAVAVFDSGLDPQYAALSVIRGTYNAVDPAEAISDPLGHGTLMALIAAGAITPLGAPAAQTGVPVLAVRTFDENGYTTSDTLMRALDYAANSGITIINMSWGSEIDSSFMAAAINYAAQRGITLFAAAGNAPTGIPLYPAAYDPVIAIGGLDQTGQPWKQSNYGDFVDSSTFAFAEFKGQMNAGTSVSSAYAAYLRAAQK